MNDGDMDAYKYLRVLEGDEIKHTKMKRRIEKEYLCSLQKIFKSKLKGGNMVQAINNWLLEPYSHLSPLL